MGNVETICVPNFIMLPQAVLWAAIDSKAEESLCLAPNKSALKHECGSIKLSFVTLIHWQQCGYIDIQQCNGWSKTHLWLSCSR